MDLDKAQSAASKAFGKMDRVFKNDIDVDLYSKLNEDSFRALAEQFGQEDVSKYINEMEYRRLNNAKSA